MGNLIDGKLIADKIKEEVKKEIENLKLKGIVPKLVAVSVGENPASIVYMNQQKKNCEKIGINYEIMSLPENIDENGIIENIEKLNENSEITGIILQLPLPKGVDTRKVQSQISPTKDVEGVNPSNMGWIVYGKPYVGPCTALAVKEIIDYIGINLYGKEVVMVGHSDIVGKPVALLLVDKFATTTICHIGTSDAGKLEEHVKRAEILIVAVGKANLIPGDWIKEGAIVIDVGINRVGDKIVGDVEFEKAKERASWITPVPGGVGPITTSILLRNTVLLAKKQIGA
ncbi:MAG: bifunctional 5,10-methylenetetrahydrofolate dehydrogenase/5,10-methenyltetrahydrofolate cyclohydrolase [bacterium]|nr:bifunctional 5,10-methylenetetrahydrofolate dehydrogenase/5,10-methenyltetrahydrofolate cyclohydrolase [bacterium]MDW8163191.1 bifunctional 5,10-methylenetetrahydrofolate dehydrogenase/5,10-methenyltetrahydrofolate cyclohydrolase [Candidatus Omnitrophota bacterium]